MAAILHSTSLLTETYRLRKMPTHSYNIAFVQTLWGQDVIELPKTPPKRVYIYKQNPFPLPNNESNYNTSLIPEVSGMLNWHNLLSPLVSRFIGVPLKYTMPWYNNTYVQRFGDSQRTRPKREQNDLLRGAAGALDLHFLSGTLEKTVYNLSRNGVHILQTDHHVEVNTHDGRTRNCKR